MLDAIIKKYHIILASSSPRRQQFLKDLGISFDIVTKEIEEIYPKDLKRHEITDFLAVLKADAFEQDLKKNDILITSDTIVWHEDKALGKPKDYEDAFAILQSLSGKTHEVITSVCLTSIEKRIVFHEYTKVSFNSLSHASIIYYLDHYKPYDKAGGYGIQEWIGLIGINKIEGSYTNVVGFPTARVYQNLLKFIK